MMKIVQINTNDILGGAGRMAFRLHKQLRKTGIESQILCQRRLSHDENVYVIGNKKMLARAYESLAIHFTEKLGFQYCFLPSTTRLMKSSILRSADVVNFHNLHSLTPFFAIPEIRRITKTIPGVWTLHDMWTMTGHCAVECYNDCDRWLSGCGSCPFLSGYPEIKKDRTAYLWKLKKRIYQQSNFVVVTPSEWMRQKALQSPLLKEKEILRIPNGVDTSIFKFLPSGAVRSLIGIGEDEKVVMFAVAHLGHKHKGVRYLKESLEKLSGSLKRGFTVLVVGPGVEEWQDSPHYRSVLLGYIDNDLFLAACYSAADVFVTASLADNLPMTVQESMACGTPVVSFRTGGIPEMVRHMETGYVADFKDTDGLARGLHELLSNSELRVKLGRNAQEVVSREYTVELQAERYVRLYERIIERKRPRK